MKVYETVEVPATTRRKEVGCQCDRCGESIPRYPDYQVRDFTLEYREGTRWPECFNYTVWEVEDLCEACLTFLHNLLKTNGFKVNYRAEDG